MSRKPDRIPEFETETEERALRERDPTNCVDWSRAEWVRLPNFRPSTASISLGLAVPLLGRIKIAANRRDMPHQSLIKAWLAEKIDSRPQLGSITGKCAIPISECLPALVQVIRRHLRKSGQCVRWTTLRRTVASNASPPPSAARSGKRYLLARMTPVTPGK